MTDAPDLVTLLYRADWTRLSLAAEVSKMTDHDLSALRSETGLPEPDAPPGFGPRVGAPARSQPTRTEWEVATDLQGVELSQSTLLIAPGGHYRHQGDGFVYGCDGDRSWHVVDDGAPVAEWTGAGRQPALSTLLQPSWLLTGFTLETGEPVTASGRAALRVVATPRPSVRGTAGHQPVDRIEVVVDAELGILLRQEEILDGKPLSVTELVSVSLDPAGAGDVAPFQPPSGWDAATEEAEPPAPSGPGWGPARIVTNLASSGLGTLVRSATSSDPFGQATREEPEAAMPEDEPLAPAGPPVSDEVLHLLYTSESRWAPEIAATLHQWRDLAAMLGGVPEQVRRVGFGGFGTLFEAVGQRIPKVQIHTVSRLRIGAPDRYQIDVIGRPGRDAPKTTVCDGQQRWHIFDEEVTVGPAAPLSSEIADMLDASWLLTARLTGGSETTVGGRRGYRLAVADRGGRRASGPDEVVVDAELGFLLRWISRPGDKVTAWYELQDVAAFAGELAEFQPDIPAGTRVVEETPADDASPGPGPGNIGASAGIFARQAAKEARSAVDELLGFFRGSGG